MMCKILTNTKLESSTCTHSQLSLTRTLRCKEGTSWNRQGVDTSLLFLITAHQNKHVEVAASSLYRVPVPVRIGAVWPRQEMLAWSSW